MFELRETKARHAQRVHERGEAVHIVSKKDVDRKKDDDAKAKAKALRRIGETKGPQHTDHIYFTDD